MSKKSNLIFISVVLVVIIAVIAICVYKNQIPESKPTGAIIHETEYRGVAIPESARGKITKEEVDELIEENGGTSEGLTLRGYYEVE